MLPSVKYHWALNEKGETIHIVDVSKENRSQNKYFCPNCGCPMIPVIKGEKRQPHFRHDASGDHCSYESYLHKLAKKRLKEEFDRRDKFLIEVDAINMCDKYEECLLRKCERDSNRFFFHRNVGIIDCPVEYKKILDLKEFYDACEIEKGCQNFIADVKLSNSKDPKVVPLFLEVRATHGCEPEKINSGIPIIEFKIQAEEDLSMLGVSVIKEIKQVQVSPRKKTDKIVFYNLNGYEDKCPYETDSHNHTIKTTELFVGRDGYLNEREGKAICHQLYTGENVNSNALTGYVLTNPRSSYIVDREYVKRCWLVYNKMYSQCCEQCKYGERNVSVVGWKKESIHCRKSVIFKYKTRNMWGRIIETEDPISRICQNHYLNVLNFKCKFFELDEERLKRELEMWGCLGWVKKAGE